MGSHEEDVVGKKYDCVAGKYLSTRTQETGITGFQNREIEQPIMFGLVPKDLSNKKVLDIGCGPGIHLKEYIERGAEGTGIDASKEMIVLAKNYCPEGDFRVENVYELPFEDSYFDIVTASMVLDHVKDLEKAVREIERVLKSNGLFIFSNPHPITNMFRKSKEFIPDHSYFDKETRQYNIADSGVNIPGFPRPLDEYFNILLKNNFILEEFIESKPKESWREEYKEINEQLLKIPLICFFKWRKS